MEGPPARTMTKWALPVRDSIGLFPVRSRASVGRVQAKPSVGVDPCNAPSGTWDCRTDRLQDAHLTQAVAVLMRPRQRQARESGNAERMVVAAGKRGLSPIYLDPAASAVEPAIRAPARHRQADRVRLVWRQVQPPGLAAAAAAGGAPLLRTLRRIGGGAAQPGSGAGGDLQRHRRRSGELLSGAARGPGRADAHDRADPVFPRGIPFRGDWSGARAVRIWSGRAASTCARARRGPGWHRPQRWAVGRTARTPAEPACPA